METAYTLSSLPCPPCVCGGSWFLVLRRELRLFRQQPQHGCLELGPLAPSNSSTEEPRERELRLRRFERLFHFVHTGRSRQCKSAAQCLRVSFRLQHELHITNPFSDRFRSISRPQT